VLDVAWREWSFLTWCFYVLGALYLAGFFHFYFAFERAERHAQTGDAESIDRFNRRLRGFPNALYAKMFGKKALEVAAERKDG
jgi:hypothetical protein